LKRISARTVFHRLTQLLLLAPLGLAAAALSLIGHRWVDILAQFTAPALTATVGLTFMAALLRFRAATTQGVLTCLVLLAALSPQWFPQAPAPRPGAAHVRLYTANVYYENTDVARMRHSIVEADADIVVLVELGQGAAGEVDELLEGYPHRTTSTQPDRTRGPAHSVIASRYPLTPTPTTADMLHDIAAVVQTPIGPVNIVGVHLTRPWPFEFQHGQIIQTMDLAKLRHTLTGPVVVTGDFNSVSSARIGRQVRDEVGLHPAPGVAGTWPADLPPIFGITIDQVYRSPELTFTSRSLGRANGSDHRPIITEFTLAAE
jgi:endonuclease/exonuclease/phosphatase (EEP) superfamily protein YafD